MSFTVENKNWTHDRIDLLTKMVGSGISFSQVAFALNEQTGSSFSRNACIGKSKRLGLATVKRKAVDKPVSSRTAKSPAGIGAQVQAINRKLKPRSPAPVQEPFTPRTAGVVSRRVTILDVKAMECRWADDERNSDGLITFCGNRTADGSSYCPCHAALAVGPGTQSERSAIRNARAIVGAAA